MLGAIIGDIAGSRFEFNNTFDYNFEMFTTGSNYTDAIRLAVSRGGDSDTLAAIVGSMAEACFPIPERIVTSALSYLPADMLSVLTAFRARFLSRP